MYLDNWTWCGVLSYLFSKPCRIGKATTPELWSSKLSTACGHTMPQTPSSAKAAVPKHLAVDLRKAAALSFFMHTAARPSSLLDSSIWLPTMQKPLSIAKAL